jgi:glutathione synthase/RimK-type ligase-like ATP-grasp enzyme
VAAGSLVGAAERVAGPGEWRTNVSLGGHSHGVDPPPVAGRLAVEAAAAAGCGLVGVDLYPVVDGGWLVLELNGAVAFDGRYSLPGRDVYEDIATALRLPRVGERSRALAAR